MFFKKNGVSLGGDLVGRHDECAKDESEKVESEMMMEGRLKARRLKA